MAMQGKYVAQGGAQPKTHYWEPFTEIVTRSENDNHCGENLPETQMRVWRPITDGIAWPL